MRTPRLPLIVLMALAAVLCFGLGLLLEELFDVGTVVIALTSGLVVFLVGKFGFDEPAPR